jgi:hypothetical protein
VKGTPTHRAARGNQCETQFEQIGFPSRGFASQRQNRNAARSVDRHPRNLLPLRLVALRRDDLLRRYGCDYRIERLYNDGHLDVPRGASTILPAGAAVPALRTVEFVGLRLVFDWRYYP